jgi:hypothetical protein
MDGVKVPFLIQPQNLFGQFRAFILMRVRFGHKTDPINSFTNQKEVIGASSLFYYF